MKFQFRSLANLEWAYTWHDRSLDYNLRSHGSYVSHYAGQFMVYGDWPVQHSHESCVPAQAFTDWINSLAAHLASLETVDTAAVAALAENWPRANSDNDRIIAACKVKYRDDKRQWYSLQDGKVSTAESKRYDTRWKEVPNWADGSYAAVFGLVCNAGYPELIDRYQLAEDCEVVYRRVNGQSPGYDAAEKIIGVDYDKALAAWRVCCDLVQAERLRTSALGLWHGHRSRSCANTAREAEKAKVTA